MPAPKPLQHRRRRFARGNGLSRRGQRRRRAMRPLDVVPEPLAQLPWKIILLTLMIGGFGLMMLYSAAGGSVRPWVIPQGVRLIVFLIGPMVMSGKIGRASGRERVGV